MSQFMSLKIKNATVVKDYGRNSDLEWLYSLDFTMLYNLWVINYEPYFIF